MTITEALESVRGVSKDAEKFTILLACSFTPLHLQTFLTAHVQRRMPTRHVVVKPGKFGDITDMLEHFPEESIDALVVALEWQDVDGRLAYRESGVWGPKLESDLLVAARGRLDRIEAAIRQSCTKTRVVVSLPTLPLPPAFHTPTWQAGEAELFLREQILSFARRTAQNARVVNASWLRDGLVSDVGLDLKSDLLIGAPHTLSCADRLAQAFAQLAIPAPALKGIISDLDNTLWSGLVGEVGPAAVRWDAASRYQLHGLYQRLLSALADEGVLIGIASKNDPSVVQEALERQDLLIPSEKIFPIEVHWAPKSESVGRILKAWNISADAVAFVDDTPMELAEVASVHSGITCIPFPTGDYNGVLAVLNRLRDLCGKSQLTEEDALRLESLRTRAVFETRAGESASPEGFLDQLAAKIVLDFDTAASNIRVLELINKTNQFNLNGKRLSPGEWQQRLSQPRSFAISVKYQDKFGPLGTIAVIQGHEERNALEVETWVMSCRAFSRRIEHQCMKMLFERFEISTLRFDFAATAKNGPLREFFGSILGDVPDTRFALTRDQFLAACPELYHTVEESKGAALNG